MDKPTAWYDPSNGTVSTDKDCPLFTPLGQVLPLYLEREWVGLKDKPVAVVISESGANVTYSWWHEPALPIGTKLYTTPQRTWVGLTDEDDIDWEEGGTLKDLVKAIEKKLKDKNNAV